jgi:hypothetical protein
METLEFSWSADGAVEVTDTWVCNPETDIDLPSQTTSIYHFIPGWNLSIDINGVQSLIMVSGSLTLSRGASAIWVSNGQQAPHLHFSGPMEAKGKAKFLVESGLSSFFSGSAGSSNNALIRNQQPMSLTFTDPVSGDTLVLSCHTAQFMNPVLDIGQKYLQVDVEFEWIANTTDAITDTSVGKAVLTTTQSAPF